MQSRIRWKISEKFNTDEKLVNFVFHRGSGSEPSEIEEAIGYGVIKMNIDTGNPFYNLSIRNNYEN